jgi:ABC-type transport system substrate-binding protein
MRHAQLVTEFAHTIPNAKRKSCVPEGQHCVHPVGPGTYRAGTEIATHEQLMVSLRLVPLAVAISGPMLLFAHTLAAQEPIRVAVRARSGGADRLNPLRYVGGFETKTMLYETLVVRGEDGRLRPGLASWKVENDGRTFRFELREGAVFHDGKPVTSQLVKTHFQRWVGLPEHDWFAGNRHITGVEVENDRVFRIHCDMPYNLPADLVVINPCAILGPGARDWEGEWKQPMGTGPFKFVGTLNDGKGWRLKRSGEEGPTLDVCCYPRGRDVQPIEALRRGDIDAFVGGWDEDLPAEQLDELAKDPRFTVQTSPGSSVAYLSFRLVDGPTADLAVRQRIAAAIDRKALVETIEGGRADVCTAWAAPSIAFWPRGAGVQKAPAKAGVVANVPKTKLRLAAGRGTSRAARIAEAVRRQLEQSGFEVEFTAAPVNRDEDLSITKTADGDATLPTTSGEQRAAANKQVKARAEAADVRIEITHGAPYDPHQSLVARFGPVPGKNKDEPRPRTGVDQELQILVAAAMMTPDEQQCMPLYAQIQALMDQQALIVPLYSPNRIALHTKAVDGIKLSCNVYSVDLTGLHRLAK